MSTTCFNPTAAEGAESWYKGCLDPGEVMRTFRILRWNVDRAFIVETPLLYLVAA